MVRADGQFPGWDALQDRGWGGGVAMSGLVSVALFADEHDLVAAAQQSGHNLDTRAHDRAGGCGSRGCVRICPAVA
jgi:hypothetical protein